MSASDVLSMQREMRIMQDAAGCLHVELDDLRNENAALRIQLANMANWETIAMREQNQAIRDRDELEEAQKRIVELSEELAAEKENADQLAVGEAW